MKKRYKAGEIEGERGRREIQRKGDRGRGRVKGVERERRRNRECRRGRVIWREREREIDGEKGRERLCIERECEKEV